MFKKSLLSIAILGTLAAYYYLAVIQPNWEKHVYDTLNERLLPKCSSYDIRSLTLMRPPEADLRLERDEKGWRLTSPHRGRASFLLANGMAAAFANSVKLDAFETKMDEFERYGLKEPHLSIGIEIKDPFFSDTLFVGQKHPIRSAYYARWAHAPEETFLIDADLVHAFSKSEYTLREKKVFAFENQMVRRVTIDLFGTFTRLYRDNESHWRVQDAPQIKVEEELVSKFFDRLNNVYVKEFLDKASPEDSRYGLKRTENSVTLLLDDGSVESLLIGKAVEDKNSYYAHKTVEEEPLILVAKPNIHALVFRAEDFVDRRIVHLDPEEVHVMELKRGNYLDVFKREAGGEWKRQEGKVASVETQEAVSAIVDQVSSLNYEAVMLPKAVQKLERRAKEIAILRLFGSGRLPLAEIEFLSAGSDWMIRLEKDQKNFKIAPADLELLGFLIDSIEPVSA